MVPRQLLCASLRSSWSPRSAIWQNVINYQFRDFAAALLGPVHFLSPDQLSGIHCLIICTIQLLTSNNLGGTWRRICSPDIWSISASSRRVYVVVLYKLTFTYLLTQLQSSLLKGTSSSILLTFLFYFLSLLPLALLLLVLLLFCFCLIGKFSVVTTG